MALQSPAYRPQTLRQAKRVYRKSSANLKLPASELAAIERRAVLQERAEKIREKAARKKTNIKRREEKKEKEREALLRQGREVPKEGFCKVGASQLDLTRFLPMGRTGSEQEDTNNELDWMKRPIVEAKKQDERDSPGKPATSLITMPPPPRPPLKEVSTNTFGKASKLFPKTEPVVPIISITDDFFVSNTQIERELSPPPVCIRSSAMDAHQIPPLSISKPVANETELLLAQILTQDLDYSDVLSQAWPIKDTQSAPIPSITAQQQASSQTLQACDDALSQQSSKESHLLKSICTQDLDLSDLSQFRAHITTGPLPQKSTSLDYLDGFSDHDLECLAEEIELQSSSRGSHDTQLTRYSGG